MEREINISRMVDQKVHTENLIQEVEKRPAIWNTAIEDYTNKTVKRKAWHDIMVIFIPNYEIKSHSEKNEMLAIVQRKWKGIRSCYTRELLRKKKDKVGPGANGRKEYTYFESLRFLESVSRSANIMDENNSPDNENEDEQEIIQGVQEETGETEIDCHKKFRKRKSNDNDEFIHVLKKKVRDKSQQVSSENDEDRLFLLSLVSELHKVPADRKLKLKSDIIDSIAQAQHWPHHLQYQTPTYHPSQVSHYTQQPISPEDHQHSHPHRSTDTTIEPTPSTSTLAPSPAISDVSSQLSSFFFKLWLMSMIQVR